jgi:hypothetical protein
MADQRFDNNGKLVPLRVRKDTESIVPNPMASHYEQLLSDLYFEVGAFERVTVFGDFLFLNSQRMKNEGGDINYHQDGVGDLLLGARFGILQVPFALALEGRVTVPFGDVNGIIPLGPGDTRSELRLAASKMFERVPIYVDGEFGFTLRGTAVPKNLLGEAPVHYENEIFVHAEVGGSLVRWKYDRVILSLNVEHRQSVHLPDMDVAATTIFPAKSSLTTVGGTLLVYFIRNLGATLRINQVVASRLLPSITTYGAGLFGTY